jgi:hypothetical protein
MASYFTVTTAYTVSLITSIILDGLFHGRWNVNEYPDTNFLAPESHCKDICVYKTKTLQFSIHFMNLEATQVNLEELELCSLVMLTINFKVLSHPTVPKHDINM